MKQIPTSSLACIAPQALTPLSSGVHFTSDTIVPIAAPLNHSKGAPAARPIRPKNDRRPELDEPSHLRHPHQHFIDPRAPLYRSSTPSTPSIIGSRYEVERDATNVASGINADPTSYVTSTMELLSAAKGLAQEVRAIHELVESYDRTTVEDAVMVLAQLQHRMVRRSLRLVREIELVAGGGCQETHSSQPGAFISSTGDVKSPLYPKVNGIASSQLPCTDGGTLHTIPSARPADVSPVARNSAYRSWSHSRSHSIGDEPRTPYAQNEFLFAGAGGSLEIGSDSEYPDPSLSFVHEDSDVDDD
jgi:hypothetical protein